MKVVAYLRVSTDAQAERGLGLDVQRHGIRAWAKAGGHRIVGWHSDEGISGSNGVEHRIGLHDALADLQDGRAAGIVVYRLDRLARQLTVQETTLAAVWTMGGTVFSADIGEVPKDDPDDPMKTALRQMIGVFAELERGTIRARLRAGRRIKHERGEYAGFGSPSYGQKAEGGKLVADEQEQAALARIAELHAEGASLREMATTLTAEGFRPKRSDRWHPESLRRIAARLGG